MILEFFKAIIYGIIEGITEWLPISSTGHLILAEQFLNMDVSKSFLEMLRVIVQFGAIFSVILLFWNKLWPFHKADLETGSVVDMDKITLWLKIAVSCLPAVIIGLPLDDKIDALFYNKVTVAIMLIVYGVLYIIVENYNKNRRPKVTHTADITWSLALLVGIFQVLALIPGTSRSGATILGGLIIGLSRKVAAEYTFYLAIPVMFGASLLKMIKFGFSYNGTEVMYIIVGMIVSFIVSIFAIKFLMGYIRKHDFKVFGWYRIALGIIVLLVFFITK